MDAEQTLPFTAAMPRPIIMHASESSRYEPVCSPVTARKAREYALVLEATGVEASILRTAEGFIVAVPADRAEQARFEITAYDAEQLRTPSPISVPKEHAGAWIGVVGYATVLFIMALLVEARAFGVDWTEAGMTRAALIRGGQWWRATTALTLHSGGVHLMGNVVIGAIVGLFAGRMLGPGVAWWNILFAGAAGNILNAWVRAPSHASLGASTAVFGALGLIAGVSFCVRSPGRASGLRRFAPLIGATVLLSFLGTGSGRTDVGAHVFGFLCGLGLGLLNGAIGMVHMRRRGVQVGFGLLTVAVLMLTWWRALRSATAAFA